LKYDCLIVGAGFSGLVIAERLATQCGLRSLIVEKRSHIGGNAYDAYDATGVRIHCYGPHYFRTNSQRVVDYLSQFTEWHPVAYKILSWTRGRYWSFPVNLNTFEQFIGRASTTEEFEDWLRQHRAQISHPANSEEVILSQVGREFYELFFEGYTRKQWRRNPKELDASVCGRIPVRTNRDDRYLSETFQALPRDGYTRMFEQMLAACGSRVEMLLETDYREVLGQIAFRQMVYTGPIDEYFGHRLGSLPYRSLRFELEHHTAEKLKQREAIVGKAGFWQPAVQVNYPNDFDYTRTVEIKHATGQDIPNTTVVREFPDDYGPGKSPYYPIPTAATASLYAKYKALADAELNVSFIGRLATYRYYNMDQVTAMALTEFEKLKKRFMGG
jgi:UDP-galactopyranose mutase